MNFGLILANYESHYMRKDLPLVRVGNMIKVSQYILEGDKKRVQTFSGLVIAKKNRGLGSTFTVRHSSNKGSVEKSYNLHNPTLISIDTITSYKVRKAKLYYTRKLFGKKLSLKVLK